MGMYTHLTEEERNFLAAEAVATNKFNRLSLQFDKLMMQHEEMLGQINEKVLMENGTDDDLTQLLIAEAEEVKKEGGGILSALIGVIKSIFKKIKEFLFGKEVDEDKYPEEIKLEADPDKTIKEGKGLMSKIRSFFGGDKGAIHAIEVGTAGAGAFMLGKKFIAPTIKNAIDYSDEVNKFLEECEKKLPNCTPEEQAELKKAMAGLQKSGNIMSKIVHGLIGGAMGQDEKENESDDPNRPKYSDVKDKNEEEAKAEADKKAADAKAKSDAKKAKKEADKAQNAADKKEKDDAHLDYLEDEIAKYSKVRKQLQERLKKAELRANSKDGFVNKVKAIHGGEGDLVGDRKRLSELKKKKEKGKLKDGEEAELAQLLRKVNQAEASSESDVKKIKATLSKIETIIQQNTAEIDRLSKPGALDKAKSMIAGLGNKDRSQLDKDIASILESTNIYDLFDQIMMEATED